jgi:hypothetical protein
LAWRARRKARHPAVATPTGIEESSGSRENLGKTAAVSIAASATSMRKAADSEPAQGTSRPSVPSTRGTVTKPSDVDDVLVKTIEAAITKAFDSGDVARAERLAQRLAERVAKQEAADDGERRLKRRTA